MRPVAQWMSSCWGEDLMRFTIASARPRVLAKIARRRIGGL
jgi:hypothetical protein